jgi:hypothetical protein
MRFYWSYANHRGVYASCFSLSTMGLGPPPAGMLFSAFAQLVARDPNLKIRLKPS